MSFFEGSRHLVFGRLKMTSNLNMLMSINSLSQFKGKYLMDLPKSLIDWSIEDGELLLLDEISVWCEDNLISLPKVYSVTGATVFDITDDYERKNKIADGGNTISGMPVNFYFICFNDAKDMLHFKVRYLKNFTDNT